jgi:putative solute:sodium symporter small subunit
MCYAYWQKVECCAKLSHEAGLRLPSGHRIAVNGAAREHADMIERKERKPYWRHTKWQMLASLLPFVAVMIVLPLYAEQLNQNRFIGFPLGYFLAAHGFFVIAVVTVASYVNRQNAVDHWHGAHEDT